MRLRIEAHLAGEAERARHRAADLRGDAEGLGRRVGDVDRFDVAAVGELAAGTSSCRRSSVCLATAGVLEREVARRARARSGRAEVGHRLEVRHAAAIDPAEDLPAVEARVAGRREGRRSRRVEFSRVDANGWSWRSGAGGSHDSVRASWHDSPNLTAAHGKSFWLLQLTLQSSIASPDERHTRAIREARSGQAGVGHRRGRLRDAPIPASVSSPRRCRTCGR